MPNRSLDAGNSMPLRRSTSSKKRRLPDFKTRATLLHGEALGPTVTACWAILSMAAGRRPLTRVVS